MTSRLVVTAPARLDATAAPAVEAELRRCADAGPDIVVLDMAATLAADAVGRGALHGGQHHLRSRGVRLEIHDPALRVRLWLGFFRAEPPFDIRRSSLPGRLPAD